MTYRPLLLGVELLVEEDQAGRRQHRVGVGGLQQPLVRVGQAVGPEPRAVGDPPGKRRVSLQLQ